MKRILKSCLGAMVAVFAAASVTAEVKTNVNLVPAIRATGTYPTYWSTATTGARTDVNQLFDGIVWTSEPGNGVVDRRWIIGAFKSNGADPMGTRVMLTVPDAYEPGSRLVLKRYRLFRCPYWAKADRFITKWSVWGVPDGATSDTNQWQKLDERVWPRYNASLAPNCWPTTGNAPEGETNSFDCATVASSGFRAFAFVPQGSTYYDQAVADPSKVQDSDMELFQIEYDVDIYDYPLCSITNDLDFAIDDVQAQGFSPANGASLNFSQTVSAPDVHDYQNSHTYRPRGYRIEGYDFANETWTNRLEVTDGTRSFSYEVPSDPAARERIVWLYERSPYYTGTVSLVRLSEYLQERGVNGMDYTWIPSNAGIKEGHKTLFDGVTYLTNGDWRRWYGSIKDGARSQLNLTSSTKDMPLDDGDVFYLSKYRIYMTSMGSNERVRAPTAWTLKTGVGSGEPETLADSRSGVDWSQVPFSTQGANYQEFALDQTVAFSKILFTPTNSAAHTADPDQNITVSLLEVDLWGTVANTNGTLRVVPSRAGVTSSGFAPALGTLLTESGTLTAPVYVRENGEKYPCVGYRLEWLDETTGQWKLDHESNERTFSFTPNSEKAYRLVWGIGWHIYTQNGLVIYIR